MNLLTKLPIAAIILSMMSCNNNQKNASTDSASATDAALECIMTRTSVREYTADSISDSDLEKMLRAAMAAPSAGNKQPWRFVVVKERATLDTLAAQFHTMHMAAQAPMAIVVCGDMKATFDGEGIDYWVQDTSAATENLLLAAHALGLGAVWCGVTPLAERQQFLTQLLSLPADIKPLDVVVIGHPAYAHTPKDKWHPDYIHYEKW
ncbi:MAG: nitroreductase family protein [Bacteroidales bacterium]|nr:nitroreductase family protein [Bacteroidales bacterium]